MKGPKPLVEEHYHIQSLIDSQDKRVQDRTYHREKAQNNAEREKTLADSKLVAITDFWCEDCRQDFKSMSIREIETDWSNEQQRIAFYKTKHDCGKWCIRLITDRHRDGFWFKSRQVAIDRGRHFREILQPFESGYNLLYKKI